MSKKTPIGYLKCFCDFPDGEVRLDKNENPYFYCPDCSLQVLTHGGERGKMLKAKMKPIDLAIKKAVAEIDQVTESKIAKAPTKAPDKKMEVKTEDFQLDQVPEKKIKKSSGFML